MVLQTRQEGTRGDGTVTAAQHMPAGENGTVDGTAHVTTCKRGTASGTVMTHS